MGYDEVELTLSEHDYTGISRKDLIAAYEETLAAYQSIEQRWGKLESFCEGVTHLACCRPEENVQNECLWGRVLAKMKELEGGTKHNPL